MEISKRVEKFIQDYTRNCSNELCAVEDKYGKKVISYHEWLTPEQALSAVKIAREEAIEEACKKLEKCMYDNLMFQGRLHRKEVIETFIEDFKKYMDE